MVENRLFRLGDQAIFEVFHYSAPGPARRDAAQQRHRRPPRRPVRRRPRRRHRAPAGAGVTVFDGPTASTGPREGNRWIYFLAPWGMQFELVCYPDGKAWDRGDAAEAVEREHDRRRCRVAEPATGRRASRASRLPARRDPARRPRARRRIRQEEIAERFGASRLPVREALRMLEAEGLTEHEPNKGARVPRLPMHEVDVDLPDARAAGAARAGREPAAAQPTTTSRRLERGAGARSRRTPTSTGSSTSTASSTCGTYSGCHIDQLNAMVTRLWNSTQHYRRAFVRSAGQARMWVVNAEHRLLLDAVVRRDTGRRGAVPRGAHPAHPDRARPTTPASSGGHR